MFRIYRYQEEQQMADSEPRDDGFDEEDLDTEDLDAEDLDGLDSEEGLGDPEEEQEEEDSDFQGVIRTVPGACLVYKRKDEQNNYEELWVYNVGGRDMRPEIKVRNSILAGTDIDPKTQRSQDGQQTCDTTTVGNVQFLHIRGLLN